jgi:PAS domain S-box-containing protein
MQNSEHPEDILEVAVSAVRAGNGYRVVLDDLPVPIYVADAAGVVTYWNRACVDFAGREPGPGESWCVTWQLYTMDGDRLPHDQCPMAQAIRKKRAIRGEVAIAERPDGSRVAFVPYPTPLFDDAGNLTGAINMMIDISDEQVGALNEQAERCRRLARATHDGRVAETLRQMASGYSDTAAALRHKNGG